MAAAIVIIAFMEHALCHHDPHPHTKQTSSEVSGLKKELPCFTGVEGLSPVLTLSQNLWLAVEALTPLWTRWQQGAPRGRVTGTRPSVVEGILGQSSPCPVVLFTGLALPSSPARPLTMPLPSSPPGTGEARRLEGFLAWRP